MTSIVTLAVAVALLGSLPALTANAEAHNAGSRQLLQSGVPACYYLDAEKVCVPSFQNMLAVPAALQPTNTFRKAYMMALDRSEVCSKRYTAESACWADTANRCFWRKVDEAKGICLSADYAEITAFERSGFAVDLATIPSSMTCPGSKAAQFFACYAHPAPDACSRLSGCAPAPAGTTQGRPVCLPKWAAGLDRKGADALAQQVQKMDQEIFGSCEATCWLKKARTCSGLKDQASCEKNAECVYNPVVKACGKAQVAKPGKDAFDDRLDALMSACGKLTTKSACTSKTLKLEQAGKWATWKAPATAAKC